MKKIRRRRKKEQAEVVKPQKFFIAKKELESPAQTPFFQAKMEIDGPDHPAEKEADKMADQVIEKQQAKDHEQSQENMIHRQEEEEAAQPKLNRQEEEEEAMQMKLQREEEEEAAQAKFQRQEEEEESMQMKLQREEEEEAAQPKLQRAEEEEAQAKTNAGLPVVTSDIQQGIKKKKGSGTPLSEHTLREMNNAFGEDFSKVRIHRDPEAEKLSESIKAQAFTTGKDLFFNKNKFNPDSPEGKHLLAHELTHVIQQTGGKKKKKKK